MNAPDQQTDQSLHAGLGLEINTDTTLPAGLVDAAQHVNPPPGQPTAAAQPAVLGLVNRARQALDQDETAAEVLDARDQADLAYDAAKRAARPAAAPARFDFLVEELAKFTRPQIEGWREGNHKEAIAHARVRSAFGMLKHFRELHGER